MNASQSAAGCYGETAGSAAALYTLTALNCSGKNTGSGFGVQAVNAATNCFGSSNTGTGLRTPMATGCFGQTSAGAAAPALFAITATNCRGWQTAGAGDAIQADLAVTCSSQSGALSVRLARYLMPASP